MTNSLRLTACLAAALPLAGCGDQAALTSGEDYGASPKLVQPANNLLPTVNVATAVGWPEGAKPVPAKGMAVTPFAKGLDHPRTLYVLPNGDVLVAETNAPERPEQGKGLRRIAMEFIMGQAGAKTPSANRITLLRDADGDGIAETRTVFLRDLNSPFGMALVGNDFYVANTDAVVRFTYEPGTTSITTPGVKLADLPAGPRNHHWTKDLIASPDGAKLYATSGSNSNAGEHGMDEEVNRAAVLEIDRATGATRLFASGLRNPNAPAWEPQTGALWVAVNERDEIGSDLVPDYMTSVQDGAFYGWPYSYYGQHVDTRLDPPRPDLVAKAVKPDYALGSHTAVLGLAFNTGDLFPASMKGGAFIGQHGSWNRKPPSGYRVIFVPFEGGKPSGPPRDILTGFLNDKAEAQGRPVGVRIDQQGALLVADDVGNAVWRVTPAASEAASAN